MMPVQTERWRVLALVVLLVFVCSARGQVYNPTNDFSATNNPTGVWTYGSKSSSSLGSSGILVYSTESTYAGTVAFWSSATAPTVPMVSKNQSSSQASDGPTIWA